MRINPISNSNYRRQNFGAKIDECGIRFLVSAREKGLKTQELETLLKQVLPKEEIQTGVDNVLGEPAFMKVGNKDILPAKFEYYGNFSQMKPCKINQDTIDSMTKKLREIKKEDKTADNTKIKFQKIYKRDHRAELIKIFGQPVESIWGNVYPAEYDY